MRYDDASQAGSTATDSAPVARPDVDLVPAGTPGPASGNVITGQGTVTGAAGADTPGTIVEVHGAGAPTTGGAGAFQATGQFGVLNMDASGNFSYVANAGTPQGAADVFSYTLADAAGATASTTLTFNIGSAAAAAAVQGVVNLPPGVEMSDIKVSGRDLIITMPDGTQMVIPGGAVFVPQLVIGDTQVPPSNLAALLIDSEGPQTGSTALQSSGGNFDVPVPPLDPGVPLGDLIPPTFLQFPEPDVQELFDAVDRDPVAGTLSVQLDDDDVPGRNGNAGGTGDDAGAPNATATGSLPGSDGDGDLTWALLGSGAPAGFTYALQPNGSLLVQQVQNGSTVTVLTITVNPATGAVTVVENFPILHPTGADENNVAFVVNYTVTDQDGDTAPGTLNINVDDDTPLVTVQAGSDATVILTTDDADTDGVPTDSDTVSTAINFGGVFSGTTVSPGADGAGAGSSSSYALAVTALSSGLESHDLPINLFLVGGVVIGSTAANEGAISVGNTIFTVSTTNTGVVTLTQFQQIDHPAETPSDAPFNDQFISMSDGLITLTRTETVVDRDGDQVTGSAVVSIGANLRFTDDGPTIDPVINQEVRPAIVDESPPVEASTITLVGFTKGDDPDLSGDPAIGKGSTSGAVVNANALFGADGPAAGGGLAYSLVVGNGGVSGLTTTEGTPITLVAQSSTIVVGVLQGTTTAAFAIQIDASTGIVTVEQYLSINHPDFPNNFDESVFLADGSLGVTVTATDFDGDTAASPVVDITDLIDFQDDGPSVNPALNANATVVLDESGPGAAATIGLGGNTAGDDEDVTGSGPIARGVSGGAVVDPNAVFGADGPLAGSPSFQLVVSNANSGVTTTEGEAINLVQLNATTILGIVAGVGEHGGDVAFALQIDTTTGVVTVEQYLSLDHPVNPDPNDPLQLGANTVGVTVTATDGDLDSITSGAIDISGQITFLDDGPTATPTLNAQATVTLDESGPGAAATISLGANTAGNDEDVTGSGPIARGTSGAAVINANGQFGADGEFSTAFALTVTDPTSALTTTEGEAINLVQLNATTILGIVAAGGEHANQVAFAVQINSTSGIVTVEQYLSLDHPVNPNPNDPLTIPAGEIGATLILTDGDGDPTGASAPVDISGLITFLDDGPTATPALNVDGAVTVDESGPGAAATIGLGGNTAGNDEDVTGSGPIGRAVGAAAIVTANAAFGADGPQAGSPTHQLVVSNANSGLTTTEGEAITLVQLNATTILGIVAAGGEHANQVAFAMQINSTTGVVTVEQYLSLDHPVNPDPNDPLHLGANTVGVTVTATDGDGDPFTSGVIDVSQQITFLDDGPSADPTINAQATVVLDESGPGAAATIGLGGNTAGNDEDVSGSGPISRGTSGVSVINSNGLFGADGEFSSVFGLSVGNASSGLTTTEGEAITLVQLNATTILGIVAAGGEHANQVAFAVQINGSGVVTVEQYLSLDHPVNPDPNDPLTIPSGRINATVTLTDGDGDPAGGSSPVDISGLITFRDDGPSASPTLNAQATVTLDESGPGAAATIGLGGNTAGNDEDVSGSGPIARGVSGAAVLNPNGLFGADGEFSRAFGLTVTDATSALTTTEGEAINLVQLNATTILGVVVAGGEHANQVAFAVQINATSGIVTVEQYLSLDHPVNPNPNDPLTIPTGEIGATVALIDGDGDPSAASAPVDISGLITFLDDGPTATPALNVDGAVTLDETGPGAAATIGLGGNTAGNDEDVTGSGPIARAVGGATILTPNAAFGADGPQAGSPTFQLTVSNASSGLTTTEGEAITLVALNSTTILGIVAAGGEHANQVAFAVQINSTSGVLTVEQYLSLDHPVNPDPNDPLAIPSGRIGATVTATDGDGDPFTSTAVDISGQITFLDDGPSAVTAAAIASGLDNGGGDSATASLDTGNANVFDNFGADGGKVIFNAATITALDGQNLQHGGTELTYVISNGGQTIDGFVDANTNGVLDGGDTQVFTIELQFPAGGTSDYKVTMHSSIDTLTTVNFSDATHDFVGGNDTWAGFVPNDQVDGKVGDVPLNDNSQDLLMTPIGSGTAVNGNANSAGVTGPIAGQNIGNGEGMRLDFVEDLTGIPTPGDYADPGEASHDFDNHYLVDAAVLTFGDGTSTSTTASFKAFLVIDPADDPGVADPVAGTGSLVSVTSVAIKYDGVTATVNFDPLDLDHTQSVIITDGDDSDGLLARTYTVEFVQDGGSGEWYAEVTGIYDNKVQIATFAEVKYNALELLHLGPSDSDADFAITGFGFATSAPSAKTFTVPITVTDGDGDTVDSGILSIHVTPPAPPVVLDMNGDGVHFLSSDAGVHYDYGSGLVATAWADPNDGILVRDSNGNGTVDNASEFVFGGNGLTDVQALAAQYGSTLDANDADFSKFAVWQDANSNGVADAGEVNSLTALGITSISLSTDGISYKAANDDVTVAGTGSYTNADGSTGALADAAFSTGARAAEDQLRTSTAMVSNAALIGAIAAAGLAAAEPLAAHDFNSAQGLDTAAQHTQAFAPVALDAVNGSGGLDLADIADGDRSIPDAATEGSASHGDEGALLKGGLDASGGEADGHAPDALPGGTDTPAAADAPAFTDAGIAMPDAGALIAAQAGAVAGDASSVGVQHNQVVSQVLVDALQGGGDGPNIDALVNSLPQAENSPSAADALAMHGAAAVSNVDSSAFAAFTADALHVSMLMHQDAAPAAV